MAERVFVTGVLGCLGAWVCRAVLDEGDELIGFDLGDDRGRLELVLGADASRVRLVRGDVTDLEAVERVLDEHDVTRVVHLAALQVPSVRADPPRGMRVNVAGTVNVFEAVARRRDRIPCVAYASSAAVYGPSDPSPAPEPGSPTPATLYGVSKLADEGMARVYAADAGLPSVGIRPFVVYGPGRDQGMTSGPSLAMRAVARGEPYHVAYGGTAQYDYVPDVARAFVAAAHSAPAGAVIGNFPGVTATMAEVVAAIEVAAPEATGSVTWDDVQLPFPSALRAEALERALGPLPRTPLHEGVAATVEAFRAAA